MASRLVRRDGELLDRGDRPAELVERGCGVVAEIGAAGAERGVELAVVPQDRWAGARAEACPERVAVRAVVEQDRPRVVELVGERDAQLVRRLVLDRRD